MPYWSFFLPMRRTGARPTYLLTYPEVERSGLGRLCCLSAEVYGRWGADPLWLVPALAREKARGLPSHIRRGMQLVMETRWWSLLAVAVQRQVAHAVLREHGADLDGALLEPCPFLAELPLLP